MQEVYPLEQALESLASEAQELSQMNKISFLVPEQRKSGRNQTKDFSSHGAQGLPGLSLPFSSSHCLPFFLLLCVRIFVTDSCYIAQLALNSWQSFLPRPSKGWDYRYEPPNLPFVFIFLNYLMLLRELTIPDILKKETQTLKAVLFIQAPLRCFWAAKQRPELTERTRTEGQEATCLIHKLKK